MIKKLIEDLASDKISVTSGLTQSKIIASKIKNEELKEWIQNELKGYPDSNPPDYLNIPDYRKLKVEIKGELVDSFGRRTPNVLLILDKLGEEIGADMNLLIERHDLGTIEHSVTNSETDFVINPFQHKFVQRLNESVTADYPDQTLVSAGRHIAVSQLRGLLFQVKQRLLDTLIELNEAFPDLEDKFNPTEENKSKTNNIVNFNIYGGANTTNLGVGETVTQKDIKQTIKSDFKELEERLKTLNVENDDIKEVIEILKSQEKEKTGSKIMGWLKTLATKAIGKGIELKLPEILETIQGYM